MKKKKGIIFLLLILGSLVQITCGNVKTQKTEGNMQLAQPSFLKVPAYYNTYVAGVEGGGQGIELYIKVEELPEHIVMGKVYFRGGVARLMQSNGGYVGRFLTESRSQGGIVMSSDVREEAVNTPPMKVDKFPFALEDNDAGISYQEFGDIKYTKISHLEERKSVAYPSAPPKDGGN